MFNNNSPVQLTSVFKFKFRPIVFLYGGLLLHFIVYTVWGLFGSGPPLQHKIALCGVWSKCWRKRDGQSSSVLTFHFLTYGSIHPVTVEQGAPETEAFYNPLACQDANLPEADLRGYPTPPDFYRDRVGPPYICKGTKTGLLTVCGHPGATAFLLKKKVFVPVPPPPLKICGSAPAYQR